MDGSTLSASSSRADFSGVPVATITMPAWVELPIPTPPPLWIEIQSAPQTAFASAFRSGQSAMASLPSFMASVSRFGEATEPQSR